MLDENTLKTIVVRIEKLEKEVFSSSVKKKQKDIPENTENNYTSLDFSLNERAFAKRYIIGKGGPQRFTLIISFLVKGKEDTSIELAKIVKLWSRMSSKKLLGSFNRFYSSEAKTSGWVDTREHGMYVLTKEWRKCL